MEHFIVSARKYRPSTFSTVVGQPALTATLKNAIATERLAHAYLFCGSRGVGKTSCARIFAKTINCQNPTPDGEACNECDSCREFNEGRSLNVVELDAASHNGIDDIRSMIEQVQLPPTRGRYRVFVIDEVHMLSTAAFNAFLKTLEEPPSYVIFVLATTEKHKIIPTILSRCQIFDFNRITIRDMVSHLQYVAQQEGYTADPAALAVIASKADGAMRDALSIFDQVAASSRGRITYESTIDNLNVLDHAYYKRLVDAFLADDVPTALTIYKEIRDKGFDSQFFINGLALYMRDLMLAANPQTLALLEIPDEMRREYAELAARCTVDFLYKAMDLCNMADLNFRQASDKQFLVELTLIKLCQPAGPSHGISGDGEGQLKPIAARPKAPAKPAPTPQPAPAPTVQRAAAAQPAPAVVEPPRATYRATDAGLKINIRMPDVPINLFGASAQRREVEEITPTRRTAAYTPDDVARVWATCADAFASTNLLANILRLVRLDHSDAGYRLLVPNEVQRGMLADHIMEVLGYMRDRLSNDDFNVELVVDEALQTPMSWDQREVLQHACEANPSLAQFVKDFNLRLL